MEHKIINTGDYLIIVDESEIKEGDWYIDLNLKQIFSKSNPQISKIDWQKKIIAHLPLNNSPILEGVILLPPLEDEVEIPMKNQTIDYSYGYRQGYNKAKEKYKYTEEDMVICWIAAYTDAISLGEENHKPLSFENFIQSLQQPKMPVGFKCEIEGMNIDEIREQGKGFLNTNTKKLKTTTNSQGLTQWVGEYIYD